MEDRGILRALNSTNREALMIRLRSSALRACSLLALGLIGPAFITPESIAQTPRTRAEASDYMETSRYADVMEFIDAVVPESDLLHSGTMGYTNEGRRIPLIVAGRVENASAAAVADSGKLRVYLQGNIHAGEVCGKEALQMLLREVAQGDHNAWFEDVVLLIAPIYNADGNERVDLGNRPGQNGPYGGMGQRPNAQDLDLNRDHMKLESPEARSVVGMMREYDPHVSVDLHTTNGTRHAYHLTYSPPLNPNTHSAIDDLLRDRWLPAMTESIRAKYGWEYYYYGNTPFRRDAEPGWYTFDHRPRFNNNYIGLRNRVAILSEAYAYATFENRVLASLYFVREIVDYAATNDVDIRAAIDAADATSLPGDELGVRATAARSDEQVEILMGDTENGTHPLTGRRHLIRRDVVRPERMYEYGSFEPTATETVPAAYLVPGELDAVIDRLRAHGIRLTETSTSQVMQVEEFHIESSQQAAREFQGHQERRIEGAYELANREIPAATWRVEMNQPLARLAFYLLEPRSDDGLANWNFLDEAIEASAIYPIVRVPAR
ncbi:MAG: peptidase M14 [Acidobacteria bacterium]|nr:peptidase M14 [Acidobacteriota bacterium]